MPIPYYNIQNPSALLLRATGSTSDRSAGDRAADVVNVKDHGARGDGSTNDLAALTAAAVEAGNARRIVAPAGNYILSGGTLNLDGTVQLEGEGRENTIFTVRSNTGAGIKVNSGAGVTTHGFRIADMTIRAGSGATGHGIEIGNPGGASPVSAGGRAERVTVSGFTTSGVRLLVAQIIEFIDLWAESNGDGVRLEGTTNENDHVFFRGGRFRSNTRGLWAQQFDVMTLDGVDIESNTEEAIRVERLDNSALTQNLTIRNCWIEANNTSRDPSTNPAQVKFTAAGVTAAIANVKFDSCRFTGRGASNGERHIYFDRGSYELLDNWFGNPGDSCLVTSGSSECFIYGRTSRNGSGPDHLWVGTSLNENVPIVWEHMGISDLAESVPRGLAIWVNKGNGTMTKVLDLRGGDPANPTPANRSPALGVFGVAPVTRPDVTGSRGANAALASLLTALASLGLITDSSS